jgi:hypothetical protein
MLIEFFVVNNYFKVRFGNGFGLSQCSPSSAWQSWRVGVISLFHRCGFDWIDAECGEKRKGVIVLTPGRNEGTA